MNRERVFYQDFLFEDLPVDEQDNPKVDVIYSSDDADDAVILSLDKLMRMNKFGEWDNLVVKIKNRNVVIVDDVSLVNEEVEPYKKLYLTAYFCFISKGCNKCVVSAIA